MNYVDHLSQQMKQTMFTLYYNGTFILNNTVYSEEDRTVWLLGVEYTNEEAQKVYRSFIWLTYREGLAIPNSSVRSDAQWGCMLRVGQMVMATTLRKYFKIDAHSKEPNRELFETLVDFFIKPTGPFSIESMLEQAQHYFQKGASNWFSPNEVASLLCLLNQKACLSLERDQKRIKAPCNFLVCSVSPTFCYERILQEAKSKLSSFMVMVPCRGDNDKKFITQLIWILRNMKHCIGVLGGSGTKAYYIVGTSGSSFVYLDPHFITHQNNLNHVSCDKMVSFGHGKVDPCFTVCFYAKSKRDLWQLNVILNEHSKEVPFAIKSTAKDQIFAEDSDECDTIQL